MAKKKKTARIGARNQQDLKSWQLAHIKEGLRQARAGIFATNSEVAAVFERWKK